MLRFVCVAALMLLNYVLQSTLLPHIAIINVTPDTGLILTVGYGILRGDGEGAVFGFFTGLIHDIFGAHFLGLYALLGMLTGYVCGKPAKDYFHDNYFLPFLMVVAATLGYQVLFYFFNFLFRGKTDFWFYCSTLILPKTIYTASFAVPLYAALHAINVQIERYEHTRRRLFKEEPEERKH